MDIVILQDIIPCYVHETIRLLYIHIHDKYLFMNNKMISSTNNMMRYLIKFYSGKRTTSPKRNQTKESIQELLTSIINFSKIIDLSNIDLNKLQKDINQIVNDLETNNYKQKKDNLL